jgi:glucan phosphorylase
MEKLIPKLQKLTQNLWWTWRPEVRGIFRDLDSDLYDRVHRNPIAVLKEIDPEQLEEKMRETDLPSRIDRARRQLAEYLHPVTTWGLTRAGALRSRPVIYFSAEFGIHECIPIYSGGLGISRHHLEGASDLGMPLIGIGLLPQGYVQELDADYRQRDVIEPSEGPALEMQRTPGNPVGWAGAAGRTVFLRIQAAELAAQLRSSTPAIPATKRRTSSWRPASAEAHASAGAAAGVEG